MAGSEIGDDRPNLQNGPKWQNMTYFQICDMAKQVRIHEISRSPSCHRPPKIRVSDRPTDRRTDGPTDDGRTHPLIELWLLS